MGRLNGGSHQCAMFGEDARRIAAVPYNTLQACSNESRGLRGNSRLLSP
jgi:hypothetical protein